MLVSEYVISIIVKRIFSAFLEPSAFHVLMHTPRWYVVYSTEKGRRAGVEHHMRRYILAPTIPEPRHPFGVDTIGPWESQCPFPV